jgi:hypothetical protein
MPIKNIRDLRSELCSVFEQLKGDPRRVDQAKELSNAAGKIIGTCKVEIEYAGMRKEKPTIQFLD